MRLSLAQTLASLGTTLFFLPFASALPLNSSTTGCTQVAQRQEWRTLTGESKGAYISAVKCLNAKPSILGLNSSRYNDFPYVHAILNNEIHFVAEFLPWHRGFVHLYETALRSECQFQGNMPYWDWTLDSGTFLESPLFSPSPTIGFGGNAPNGGFISPARPNPLTSCVLDGAFANFTVNNYVDSERPHCLNRGFSDGHTGNPAMDNDYSAAAYSPATIANITASTTTFKSFTYELENTPHGAIHFAIGGDMIPKTSPNDPLFFLHHAQIDRLWWIWQQIDPQLRHTDFEGIRKSQDGTILTEPATLSDVLPYLGLVASDPTVADVMTTENNLLCYKYI